MSCICSLKTSLILLGGSICEGASEQLELKLSGIVKMFLIHHSVLNPFRPVLSIQEKEYTLQALLTLFAEGERVADGLVCVWMESACKHININITYVYTHSHTYMCTHIQS